MAHIESLDNLEYCPDCGTVYARYPIGSDCPNCTSGPVCQDCGDVLHIDVEWNHWGVDVIHYECTGCGRAGKTTPEVEL